MTMLLLPQLLRVCCIMWWSSDRHGYKKQQCWISNGLTSVRTDQALLSQFKEVVLTELGWDYYKQYSKLIKATWQQIVEGSMRGLAKYINNKDFGNKKATSTNHVTFRNQVDCGAKTADSEKPKKKSAKEIYLSFRKEVAFDTSLLWQLTQLTHLEAWRHLK